MRWYTNKLIILLLQVVARVVLLHGITVVVVVVVQAVCEAQSLRAVEHLAQLNLRFQ
jgi:hypothetical protein